MTYKNGGIGSALWQTTIVDTYVILLYTCTQFFIHYQFYIIMVNNNVRNTVHVVICGFYNAVCENESIGHLHGSPCVWSEDNSV